MSSLARSSSAPVATASRTGATGDRGAKILEGMRRGPSGRRDRRGRLPCLRRGGVRDRTGAGRLGWPHDGGL